mmetsp:Transcript_133732/g.231996  ORF Transcript_133732/g.231996 Transcript_133732/m.231996 type:complete len:220 (-) Transcript_133732:1608-2267(-)
MASNSGSGPNRSRAQPQATSARPCAEKPSKTSGICICWATPSIRVWSRMFRVANAQTRVDIAWGLSRCSICLLVACDARAAIRDSSMTFSLANAHARLEIPWPVKVGRMPEWTTWCARLRIRTSLRMPNRPKAQAMDDRPCAVNELRVWRPTAMSASVVIRGTWRTSRRAKAHVAMAMLCADRGKCTGSSWSRRPVRCRKRDGYRTSSVLYAHSTMAIS